MLPRLGNLKRLQKPNFTHGNLVKSFRLKTAQTLRTMNLISLLRCQLEIR